MLFYLFLIVVWLMCLLIARTLFIMYQITFESRVKEEKRDKSDTIKTVIVIGSGGHTGEMLNLVKHVNRLRYTPRFYIMSATDEWSEQKIVDIENQCVVGDYKIIKIPRSREVHQSYLTSVFSTLYSLSYCMPIIFKVDPDLVVCNGPGTCIPVCFVALFLRILFLSKNKILFIESVCRVKTLSLSGKILLYFADELLVQWPELQFTYPRVKYVGRL